MSCVYACNFYCLIFFFFFYRRIFFFTFFVISFIIFLLYVFACHYRVLLDYAQRHTPTVLNVRNISPFSRSRNGTLVYLYVQLFLFYCRILIVHLWIHSIYLRSHGWLKLECFFFFFLWICIVNSFLFVLLISIQCCWTVDITWCSLDCSEGKVFTTECFCQYCIWGKQTFSSIFLSQPSWFSFCQNVL